MSIQFKRYALNEMNDLKFALRQLRKSPGFTCVAILTLALGIGLNTAIFSLINNLFLKGLPFQEPERVLHILTQGKAALAWQLVPLVPKLAANFLPIEQGSASALSVPVVLFTIGLSLLTGFAMGLYPALQSSRADIVDALKEGGRGTQGSVRQQRFRKILVGAQVALSVTLLAGASLLITSFVRLSQQDPGFNTDK